MKKKLIALLAALSIKPQFANAEAPTEAETEAAIDLAQARVAQFANETTGIKQKLLNLCKKAGITFANEAAITDPAATITQVEDKLTAIQTAAATAATDAATALTAAQTQFANERAARITDALGHALTSGRITEAEKPTWLSRLNVPAQFANELGALQALTPKVKTTSVTINRGGRETQVDVADPKARRQFVNEVSAEIAAELKLDPAKDARRIASIVHQRHPALFTNVPHVEIKLPGGKKG